MRRISLIAILTPLLSAIISCSGPQAEQGRVGAYAKSLISDTSQVGFQIISNSRHKNITGNISIIGEPEFSLLLSEYFKECDNYDNVSGKSLPDGLPDFSGETICPILDRYNSPYYSYCQNGTEERLSDINVMNFVTALDTACYLNAYDTEKIVHKSMAKLVVLSSIYSSEYGYSDIDTLRLLSNSKVKVISPVHTLLDQAWNDCGQGLNVGIWTDSTIASSDIYGKIFAREKAARGDAEATFTTIVPDTTGSTADRFLNFMKQYLSGEGKAKLSALIIDDLTVDIQELEEAIKAVMAVDQDRYLTYLNYLAPDFKLIDLRKALASACYRYLREINGFTHRIAYPNVKLYVTAASEKDSSYVTVELKDKYLTDDLNELMIVRTPKLFVDYVR